MVTIDQTTKKDKEDSYAKKDAKLQKLSENSLITMEEMHPLKDVIGITFFALLAGNDEGTEIADFAPDEKETLKYIRNCRGKSLPMPPYKRYFLSCTRTNCRGFW